MIDGLIYGNNIKNRSYDNNGPKNTFCDGKNGFIQNLISWKYHSKAHVLTNLAQYKGHYKFNFAIFGL